MAAQMHKSVI